MSTPPRSGPLAIRGQYNAGLARRASATGYRRGGERLRRLTTETFAAVRSRGDPAVGRGPFYMRTGKRLPRRVTEIAVVFKRAPHLPFSPTDAEELGHNQLVIRVQPDEGVTLKFGSKVPGSAMEVRDSRWTSCTARRSPSEPGGLRAADPRRADRRRDPLPASARSRRRGGSSTRSRSSGRAAPDRYRAGEWGPARPTRCSPATAGMAVDRKGPHDTLWDTTGTAVVKDLAAERRTGGAVTSGIALTLIVVVDEQTSARPRRRPRIAARSSLPLADRDPAPDRRAGAAPGRRGVDRRPARPGRGLVMRMYGRLALHAESVALPAARPRRSGGRPGGTARRRTDRQRPAGGVRRPADHRLPRARTRRRTAAARRGLRPRRHRPRLDPAHPSGAPRSPSAFDGIGTRVTARQWSMATDADPTAQLLARLALPRASASTSRLNKTRRRPDRPSAHHACRRRRHQLPNEDYGRLILHRDGQQDSAAPLPRAVRWVSCWPRSCADWTPTESSPRRSAPSAA